MNNISGNNIDEYINNELSNLYSSNFDVANKKERLNRYNNDINIMKSKIECKDQLDVINKYEKYLKNNPFCSNHNKDKQIIGFISGQGGQVNLKLYDY